MILRKENLTVFAAKSYTNDLCIDIQEFKEDFSYFNLAKSLSKKIHSGRSENIRLLCNHVICVTNNFEIQAAKDIFKFICAEEISSIKSVLLYLGFLNYKEWSDIKFCIITAKLLKEMDR